MAPPDPDPKHQYIFNRDHRSTIRLNYQHWLIKQLAGYLLHPAALPPATQATSANNPRIADIGTGTGIWPIETSEQFPSARLDGFDISPAQFPPHEWLPSNVNLHVHDAFTPFPQEHQGAYDVVHLRFFVTLVNGENLVSLVRNLVALLKPGGHLHWLDNNLLTSRAVSTSPSTPNPATESLVSLMQKPRPDATYEWIPHLPALLTQEAGLEILASESILMADRYRMFWNQSHLMAYEEYCTRMAEAGGAAAQEADRLGEEFRRGVSVDNEFFVLVARKKL